MSFIFRVLSVFLLAAVFEAKADCMHPPLASNYINEAYSGLWFEVGRIQTPGGAEFQKDCICTTTDFSSEYPVVGDGKAVYECRNYTVDGAIVQLTGSLIAGEVPGNFEQRFNPLLRGADYNVIWLDQDTAMEYDCLKTLVSEEYCVHFMSRTKSIEPRKLQSMIDYAESLGLNPNRIEYLDAHQERCL